jgi:hypothetical protein
MLATAVVEKIQDLLSAGTLSQRKIAQHVGVSRGTVNAIALGKRPSRPEPRHCDEFCFPAGPLERCPGCGGMVQMPCLLCRVRAIVARRARR